MSSDLRLDHLRAVRTGIAEAVYAPGKSPEQCAAAVEGLLAGSGTGPVMLTRATLEQMSAAQEISPGADVLTLDGPTGDPLHLLVWRADPPRPEQVVVVTAGTADIPVALETVAVLRAYGLQAPLFADLGVAGLHRILDHQAQLVAADVVVVVAGMEGALASVVAGLTSALVVAVPTSTGYGSGFAGMTALLGMTASCSPGIAVVGIDNGFGAACAVVRALGARRHS